MVFTDLERALELDFKNQRYYGYCWINVSDQFWFKHLAAIPPAYLCLNDSFSEAVVTNYLETFPERRNEICWIGAAKREFSADFFNRYLEYFDDCWKYLSENPALSDDFFADHLDRINWTALSRNPSVSTDFFLKHYQSYGSRYYWEELSTRNCPRFQETFIDKLLWKKVCSCADGELLLSLFRRGYVPVNLEANHRLTEDFFKQLIALGHIDWIIWPLITFNSNLSEQFFDECISSGIAKDIYWSLGSAKLSEDFVERNLFYMSSEYLSSNDRLSESFFDRHITKITWYYLCTNESVSEEFFLRYLDKIDPESIKKLLDNNTLSENFFEKIIDRLYWRKVPYHPNISEDFLDRHVDRLNWYALNIWEARLSGKFIAKHLRRLQLNEHVLTATRPDFAFTIEFFPPYQFTHFYEGTKFYFRRFTKALKYLTTELYYSNLGAVFRQLLPNHRGKIVSTNYDYLTPS